MESFRCFASAMNFSVSFSVVRTFRLSFFISNRLLNRTLCLQIDVCRHTQDSCKLEKEMAKSSVDQIGAMETFVLALISEGEVQTLYDLHRKARLSSGAALPALRRLEALKLIRAKSEKGSRKR